MGLLSIINRLAFYNDNNCKMKLWTSKHGLLLSSDMTCQRNEGKKARGYKVGRDFRADRSGIALALGFPPHKLDGDL